MSNSLEERLKAHSNAFDGLLSLIPAKFYYDEDTQDQWQKKKLSKEELRNNKKAKLDPTQSKNATAKEEHDARSKLAKPVVIPGSKANNAKAATEEDSNEEQGEDEDEDDESDGSLGYGSEELQDSDDDDEENSGNKRKRPVEDEGFIRDDEEPSMVFNDDGDVIEDKLIIEQENKKKQLEQNKKAKKTKELTEEQKKEKEERMAKLREKLASKINSMKSKRKAPGSNVPGSATSREQILEERRRKEELRKKKKQESTSTVEDEDDESSSDDDNEDVEASVNSGSSEVLFGNIQFTDGEKVTSDLKSLRKAGKKKGPSNNDIKAHLRNIEKEKAKLATLDEEKKKELVSKSQWSRALNSVQGIKNKDDEKLLKKALRRKESKKRKSEREWADRKQLVADTIKKKAERREENLRIRRENKGKPKGQKEKHIKAHKGPIRPKRAGFEGRVKSGKGGKGGNGNGNGKRK